MRRGAFKNQSLRIGPTALESREYRRLQALRITDAIVMSFGFATLVDNKTYLTLCYKQIAIYSLLSPVRHICHTNLRQLRYKQVGSLLLGAFSRRRAIDSVSVDVSHMYPQ